MEKKATQRLIYLEATRGLASIIVIFHHLSLAFLPGIIERFPVGVERTPLFFFLNGGAAVTFFFILSGFVLSIGLIRQPDLDLLVMTATKRLPRLALPAGLSILAGFVILTAGLNFNEQAAGLSRSSWLAGFAGANMPKNIHFSFFSAIEQSINVFILPNNFYYNSNLWTMRPEFLGSLVTFILAYAAGKWTQKSNFIYAVIIILVGVDVLLLSSENLLPFVVGVLMAYFWINYSVKIPALGLILIAIISFFLMCITNKWGNLIASAALLFVLIQSTRAEKVLSTRLGYWLGKFSFPIYLVHTLVICTVGSFFYVYSSRIWHNEWLSIVVATFVTLIATFFAAIPFVMVDGWWVPTLNGAMKRMRNLIRHDSVNTTPAR